MYNDAMNATFYHVKRYGLIISTLEACSFLTFFGLSLKNALQDRVNLKTRLSLRSSNRKSVPAANPKTYHYPTVPFTDSTVFTFSVKGLLGVYSYPD